MKCFVAGLIPPSPLAFPWQNFWSFLGCHDVVWWNSRSRAVSPHGEDHQLLPEDEDSEHLSISSPAESFALWGHWPGCLSGVLGAPQEDGPDGHQSWTGWFWKRNHPTPHGQRISWKMGEFEANFCKSAWTDVILPQGNTNWWFNWEIDDSDQKGRNSNWKRDTQTERGEI